MSVHSTVDFKKTEMKIRAALGVYANTAGKKLEREAKANKVWTDRTSNAKNSIQGGSGWRQGNTMAITLSGGVDYFVYLELAMGKRYSIIVPTMQQNSNSIFSGYKKVIR